MDQSASKNPMGFFGLQSEMGNDSDDRGKRVMEELDADDMQANWTPGRREAEAWFFADIQSLIDFRRELDAQFNTAKSNKELWRKISAKMRERGFNWSSSLCAQRWGDLLTDYYDMKRQNGDHGLSDVSYDEMMDYFTCRRKIPAQKEPLIPEAHPAFNFSETGNEQSAGLDHDQHWSGISKNDVAAANEVSAWDWTGGAHFVDYGGRVITVKWGDSVKRIGIDGSPEAIKEVIKSAFGLRTTRPFLLVDDYGILRSIDRDMPLGSYTLHLDEGLNIRIYLNNAADESPAGAEEITFYAEDDFRDFLQRCGFIALTDLSCCKQVLSIGDLHHGEVYQGYKAPAK